MNTYGPRSTTLVRGEGCWLWDDKGNKYLDALSGIAVCGLGHSHPAVAKAIAEQAATLTHCSNYFNIPLQEQLADALRSASGMTNMFFGNSGAEANEAAIKLARMYGHKRGIKLPTVVVMEKSFHGRTLATVSAGNNAKHLDGFGPRVEGFDHVAFNNLNELRAAITPRTKLILFNTPHNPTGRVFTRAEVQLIADLAIEHDLLVVTDEVYEHLLFDGAEHVALAALPGMRERTVFLHGFSKAFAMTGFRIGYACGPAAVIDGMLKVHQYGIMCAPIMSQEAAVEALRNCRDSMLHMRDKYRERRDFIVRRFNELGLRCHLPRGAFYAFVEVPPALGMSATEFCDLAITHNVVTIPGSVFSERDTHIRLSFACPDEQLAEGLAILRSLMQSAG